MAVDGFTTDTYVGDVWIEESDRGGATFVLELIDTTADPQSSH